MASLSELFSDPASSGTWTAVPEQSSITVKAKGMWGLATVKVRFTELTGEGQITAPQTVSGHLDVKASSVQTGIRQRDNHLRSADFFEAEKYPDIKIVVTRAEAVTTDTVDLHAELTIKDTTKPVILKTTVTPVGDGGMRLSPHATVNRQDFGVDGNLMGSIRDDATISGDVVFRRTS
jgi:polyisoprenoid-binding protein YceI